MPAEVRDLHRRPNRLEIDVTSVTNQVWDPLESTCRHASLSIL